MERACYRLDELFDALGIKVRRRSRKYEGSCPVHGGRNINFALYPEGYKTRGFWHCMSQHCERTFKGNIIGLVNGVLSHDRLGWSSKGDDMVPWQDGIDWLCNWLGVAYDELEPDMSKFDRDRFVAGIEMMTRTAEKPKGICSRQRLRKHLEIPATYFMERGFSPACLDEYDVGLCTDPKSELCNRVVVPVYDAEGEYVIGCIGRSVESRCEVCECFHNKGMTCPVGREKGRYSKWRVSTGFVDKNHLYNIWRAKEAIVNTRCIVLVEGAGDVWRLVSAGIPNVVGIFGSDLQESQIISLECSGATTVICLSDNDEAGNNVERRIRERCWFATQVYRPKFAGHDIGGMTENEITNSGLKDFIESKARK
jgi:hypothetical protein